MSSVLHSGAQVVLGLFVTLVVSLAVGCCAGKYVKNERERMASYIRYDRYLSHQEEQEQEQEQEAGLFAGEEQALMGRVMEFRGKDYYSDFPLAAVTSVGCYGLLYQLYRFGALNVLFVLISVHAALVVFPLLFLAMSLYTPSRIPSTLSYHIRLGYHAVVHHRATEKLNKCRGPFVNYNAVVLLGFSLGLSSLDMCRYLPWRLTRFCVMSRGYPSWAAFKWLQGSHVALLVMYIAVQTVLLLPSDMVDIRNDTGDRVYQSLATPSREVMSDYVKGRDPADPSADLLSTGALFGVFLLLLLLYRLGRGFSQHKRLITQGRTWRRALFEACVSLPSWFLSCFVDSRRRHDANSTIRPVARDTEANTEFTAVGHELANVRHRYAEDDDLDYLEAEDYPGRQALEVQPHHGSGRQGGGATRSRMHGDDSSTEDGNSSCGNEEGARGPTPVISQSAERMRSIDRKLELARGKRLDAGASARR